MLELQDLTVGQVSGMIAAAVFLGEILLHYGIESEADSVQCKYWSL